MSHSLTQSLRWIALDFSDPSASIMATDHFYSPRRSVPSNRHDVSLTRDAQYLWTDIHDTFSPVTASSDGRSLGQTGSSARTVSCRSFWDCGRCEDRPVEEGGGGGMKWRKERVKKRMSLLVSSLMVIFGVLFVVSQAGATDNAVDMAHIKDLVAEIDQRSAYTAILGQLYTETPHSPPSPQPHTDLQQRHHIRQQQHQQKLSHHHRQDSEILKSPSVDSENSGYAELGGLPAEQSQAKHTSTEVSDLNTAADDSTQPNTATDTFNVGGTGPSERPPTQQSSMSGTLPQTAETSLRSAVRHETLVDDPIDIAEIGPHEDTSCNQNVPRVYSAHEDKEVAKANTEQMSTEELAVLRMQGVVNTGRRPLSTQTELESGQKKALLSARPLEPGAQTAVYKQGRQSRPPSVQRISAKKLSRLEADLMQRVQSAPEHRHYNEDLYMRRMKVLLAENKRSKRTRSPVMVSMEEEGKTEDRRRGGQTLEEDGWQHELKMRQQLADRAVQYGQRMKKERLEHPDPERELSVLERIKQDAAEILTKRMQASQGPKKAATRKPSANTNTAITSTHKAETGKHAQSEGHEPQKDSPPLLFRPSHSLTGVDRVMAGGVGSQISAPGDSVMTLNSVHKRKARRKMKSRSRALVRALSLHKKQLHP